MRERDREIKQRRHRQEKRKKLLKKINAATDDATRKSLDEKLRKHFPIYQPDK